LDLSHVREWQRASCRYSGHPIKLNGRIAAGLICAPTKMALRFGPWPVLFRAIPAPPPTTASAGLKAGRGPGYMRAMMARPASSFALALVLLSLGCQKRDAEKCAQGLSVTRTAVKANDFALAKQWREYAYKQCDAQGEDQASLTALDQEISTAEASVKSAADAEAARKQKNDALLKLFVGWVASNRAAPDRASSAPVCDPPPADPVAAKKLETTKEQLCTASRTAGEHTLVARYWDADKTLFRFSTKFPAPVTCQDFGGTVNKTWDVPSTSGASVKRSRCDITSGALSGLAVVVSQANNADAYVFSPAYVEKDPLTKQIAGG
jgi:hypothetical protein